MLILRRSRETVEYGIIHSRSSVTNGVELRAKLFNIHPRSLSIENVVMLLFSLKLRPLE